MTPTEFQTIRSGLGVSQARLALALGVTDRSVRYWEAGEREIPVPIFKLMRLLDWHRITIAELELHSLL